MILNREEDRFIEALRELDQLENQIACTEAQADRLINTACALRAGAAISRELQGKKQQAARAAFFQLLTSTPARRFIRFVEALQ